MSAVSWTSSALSCIQPVSLCEMESCWSFHILIGAESARFTTVMTMGNLIPEALNNASCISASPCEVVEEYVLAPAALAPINADIAENSDSTFIYSQFISPSAANCARSSTICVWGVIGYADITFGLHILTA